MSMAMMVAMASRKRDERGRYAEDDEARRMGNDHSTHMGGYAREMNDQPEMRRRRDSRGRFMEGGTMAYEGNYIRMEGPQSYWPEPHIPPYLDQPEMRGLDATDAGRMRDRNIVNIRDYQDKRTIGFGSRMDDEKEGEGGMRKYGRRYDPDRMSAYQAPGMPQKMGHAGYDGNDEHLSREEAEEWVAGMKSEDGKPGPRWPFSEIKQYAANFGVQGEDKVVELFAVMNALYADYCKVAKKHGVDKVDFWADLAKAFIRDQDAVPGKVKMYYECIAKHDDE